MAIDKTINELKDLLKEHDSKVIWHGREYSVGFDTFNNLKDVVDYFIEKDAPEQISEYDHAITELYEKLIFPTDYSLIKKKIYDKLNSISIDKAKLEKVIKPLMNFKNEDWFAYDEDDILGEIPITYWSGKHQYPNNLYDYLSDIVEEIYVSEMKRLNPDKLDNEDLFCDTIWTYIDDRPFKWVSDLDFEELIEFIIKKAN